MKLKDFYFDLPERLIAQTPLQDRTSSKLMVVNKDTGEIKHEPTFKSILSYLKKGDCLVLNDTKVIPARLFGKRKHTGANIEILLLERKEHNKWEALVNPGKKAKIGDIIVFGDGILEGTIENIVDDGNRIISFKYNGIFEEVLDKLGQMPLPPYIKERLEDKNRYQTVYAKNDGSAAAPTAGLHFTNELLEEVRSKDIKIAKLTLHVGLGTFRPVKVDNILEHKMHSEYYSLDEQNAKIINDAKKNGGRIITVGTTSTRTLESIADENGLVKADSGYTNIFIYPSYKFKIVDNLITNFHLPESSLIMLVSAFSTRDNIINAYNQAVLNEYRFFSFGDAMFLTKW
ncbi:tRNA preQ1(34) S-adenosylmethionine ribosyltransferase-isomerase QueA [uncultured Tyzzerella sp.]|uniref:tRNA preQ1(34) S-adenosylmethionine ribosyltransferase-isomerase QueA n=1 Tax=uncultured Tyzzerella sp. TaxID=2321398 RepID=UPI0029421F3F|nr:tRNA preQ1(34) S-adenosylmethionine ribosyltransferase-isomerase QueA [uncultured Tyzzerella sp.]